MIKVTIKHIFVYMFIAMSVFTASAQSQTKDVNTAIARNLNVFNELYKELQTYYVDSINPDKAVTTAINAMLRDVDPYTEYMPETDQDDFMAIATGEYAGIGSYIMQRDGWVYISEPYENSPAAKSGLRPGDRIVKIDGVSTEGWKTEKVSKALKGPARTHLSVSVTRASDNDTITFDILREKIVVPDLTYYGVVRGCIGYMSLTKFSPNGPNEVKNALTELKKNPNVKAFALDLRGNGGGLLESAVKIVNMFVPKGVEVLQTRGKHKQEDKVYKTTLEPIDTHTPLYILIDGNSASASEITAGALQDLDRAVIIGNRSFGKGLVQSTRQLPYDGMLKVTIAKYYIPSGRLIQAIDYSHRNTDGEVARIPDSLTQVFYTRTGREVRDGGGITPDVKVEPAKINRLLYNILTDNIAFDYATKYAAEHPTIAAPEEFEVTDAMYEDFKKSIDPEKLKYDKVCEDILDKLRTVAEEEGYLNDTAKQQLDALGVSLKHDLNKDLDTHGKDIKAFLATEIQKRYYYDRGATIEALKHDEVIDKLMEVVNTDGEYDRILGKSVKAKSNKAVKATKKRK